MIKSAKGCIGIVVILVCIGFAVVSFFRHLKYKAIDEARNAKAVAQWSANQWMNEPLAQLKGEEWKGQYINLDGYVCDYNESSDGDYYLELTGAIQTDSAVYIGRELDAFDLVQGERWTSCDSSIARTQKLYNFQEYRSKVFINIEILDALDGVDMDKLIYNIPCKKFMSKQKRYYHQLHNFLYNRVSVKARLRSVKNFGDSLFVNLDRGIVTDLAETKWLFN